MSISLLTFKKGQIIFNEGDAANCAYIIDQGEVEIFVTRGGLNTPLDILAAGEIFGEMAIIDGRSRSASAIAKSDCSLVLVSQSQVQERVDEADPIVRLLLLLLIKRLRANNLLDHSDKSVIFDTVETPSLSFGNKKADGSAAIEKIKMETELYDALHSDQFILYYQPIVDLANNTLAGAEALIRWNSPERGLVRPDLFMGIAEETSLIVPIGKWVVEKAFSDLERLKKTNGPLGKNFSLSINVSGRQFSDPHFFNDLNESVNRFKINLENIKLEITETVLLSGPFAISTIRKLKNYGFKISLDDFGIGYSSLNYLRDISFDCLKIDRDFIKNILADEKSAVLCKAIINIGKDLNIPIVAEGVETLEQAQQLKLMGCHFGQGYFFGKPMPLEAFALQMPSKLPKVG